MLEVTSAYRMQIRNIVIVARSIAECEGEVVAGSHLEDALAAREEFHDDFHGGARQNLGSYA